MPGLITNGSARTAFPRYGAARYGAARLAGVRPLRARAVGSADLDGANYLSRTGGLAGDADGKKGLLSFWFRIDVGGTQQFFCTTKVSTFVVGMNVHYISGLRPQITLQTDTGATVTVLQCTGTWVAGPAWYHVLASWNQGVVPPRPLYIDDVAFDFASGNNDLFIDYVNVDFTIGAWTGNGGPQVFNGCLAEFWWDSNAYLDITQTDIRRRFRSAAGKPVYLGRNGELPLGRPPICYQRLVHGQPAIEFSKNRGTGGDFPVIGTLGDGSTTPSD